jgi:hypothetical protein
MRKLLQRVDEIMEQIKNKEQKSTYWYVIVINPELPRFYNTMGSISVFFRKLTNGTIKLNGSNLTNREWWKQIGANGYYRFNMSRKEIEIVFFVESEEKIDEMEFSKRVENLIGSTHIIFGELDERLFDKKLFNQEKIDSGIELFGKYKKEKLNQKNY